MSDIFLHRGRFDAAGTTLVERLALSGLGASSRLLEPSHFNGYGRIAALLRKASPKRHVVLKLEADCHFRFPFGDAYWSRLLASHVVYEPEMLALFQLIRSENYCLVDCGANFGYWSVLVTGADLKPSHWDSFYAFYMDTGSRKWGRPYLTRAFFDLIGANLGRHPAVAIEASGRNVAELQGNAALNDDRFAVVHAAVAEIDGGFVSLGGPTHEGLAIVDAAVAAPDAERAPRMSLDGLMSRSPVLKQASRIVLKLDVEGVEEAALRGASEMLARDTLLIYEEQGSDKIHANTRFVTENLGMSVFIYEHGTFRQARDPLSEVAAMKQNPRRGYNVVATRSESWLRTLRGGSVIEPRKAA